MKLTKRCIVKTATFALLVIFLRSAGAATIIDNFESYNTDGELATAWQTSSGNPVVSIGFPSAEGSLHMAMSYNTSDASALDSVIFTFGADQDWISLPTLQFQFRGEALNSSDALFIRLLDGLGGELGSSEIATDFKDEAWREISISILGFSNLGNGTDLSNVRSLGLGVSAVSGFEGSGIAHFDLVQVSVPEPSITLLSLSAIGIMLARRRR